MSLNKSPHLSRLRSIWTFTTSSSDTDRFRQYHVFDRRNFRRGYRNWARALVARSLGRRRCLLDGVLVGAETKVCNTVVRTLCNPSWPQRTLSTVSSQSLCNISRISSNVYCARFGRLTYNLEEFRLENIHNRDNGFASGCSMTQLDTWSSLRENTKML